MNPERRSDSPKPSLGERPKVFIDHSTPNNQQAKILAYVASGLLLIMTLAFLWQQAIPHRRQEPQNTATHSPSGSREAESLPAPASSPSTTKEEAEFGPYIAELQRRIRGNWQPPILEQHKRVVALFKISRDGKLLNLRIQQSSGSEEADAAALQAVRESAPFQPLPKEYANKDVDVQFVFDYEIYKKSSRQ